MPTVSCPLLSRTIAASLRTGVVSLVALATWIGRAQADATSESGSKTEKDICIAASDDGQQLRDDGKYDAARTAFMRCARPSCPTVVSRDCLQWLVDLEQRSPTVVIRARDDKGDDLVDVHVTLDGTPLTDRLDGQPIRVDPGAHTLRYEAAGFVPSEERVVIQAGTKNRLLDMDLARPSPPPAPPRAAEVGPATTATRSSTHFRSPPLPTWILGGVAVAAFASESYFAVSGMSQRDGDLRTGGCAPRCGASEVASIQTKFIAADVSLGVGIVSAGLATYFFLRPRQASPVVVGLAPSPGGASATLGGHF